jgi:hypothetical protein
MIRIIFIYCNYKLWMRFYYFKVFFRIIIVVVIIKIYTEDAHVIKTKCKSPNLQNTKTMYCILYSIWIPIPQNDTTCLWRTRTHQCFLFLKRHRSHIEHYREKNNNFIFIQLQARSREKRGAGREWHCQQ